MSLRFLVLAAACLTSACVRGNPDGAPPSACDTMVPGHTGASKQTSVSPYNIQLNTTSLEKDASILVSVSGKSGEMLRGFLVEARDPDGKIINGVFSFLSSTDPKIKVVSCGRTAANAVTHTNSDEKKTVAFIWKPPTNLDMGKGVLFRATVAQEKNTWWEDIKSVTLKSNSNPFIPNITVMLIALAFLWKLS